MARIKITDDRQGRSFRTGVNGRFYDYPLNTEQEVSDEMIQHLKDLGVAFEEVSPKGAASSKEGSEDGAAPIGDHDVRAPAMDPKTVGDSTRLSPMGDQPGDPTPSGGIRYSAVGAGPNIKDDAEVADIRVAAERSAPKDASIAEIAGEGEGGTDATKAPAPAPNKDADAKAASARKRK